MTLSLESSRSYSSLLFLKSALPKVSLMLCSSYRPPRTVEFCVIRMPARLGCGKATAAGIASAKRGGSSGGGPMRGA